jgi:large subunit ribosomal protein L31
MRQVHPYYPTCTISCACGASYPTRSTRGDFSVDVCGQCHPFYTGKQKLMDTAGRVDRFRKKFGEAKATPKPGKDPNAQGQKIPKKAKDKKAAPASAEAAEPAAEG